MAPKLDAASLDRPALEVAPALLGATLLVDGVGGRLVEAAAGRRIGISRAVDLPWRFAVWASPSSASRSLDLAQSRTRQRVGD